jgi:hypothetical protein
MSFLDHFFADDEQLAQQLAQQLARNEPLLHTTIERYFTTLSDKHTAAQAIAAGAPLGTVLPIVKEALVNELDVVRVAQEGEGHAIDGLEKLEKHHEEVRRIFATMDYALSRERFVYSLMQKLHELLTDEVRSLHKLEAGDERETVESLVGQIFLEEQIASRLRTIGDFEQLYSALALGERRKHELETQEQDAAQEMLVRMQLTGEVGTPRDAVTALNEECYARVADAVLEAVADGKLTPHKHADFEFVNSPLFEEFIMKAIIELKLEEMNDKPRIKVFTYLFREIYNSRFEKEL